MESAVIYRGISLLDGVSPIAVVVTGIKHRSGNAKTGGMIQTYIVRDDMRPKDAIDTGADVAICGQCPHRKQADGSRSCYVNLATGLSVVGRKLMAGEYPDVDVSEVALACAGRPVRLGTYGDPAAVPLTVWEALTAHASNWTGYTHQWRLAPVAPFARYLMASCDSEADRVDAKRSGWRTFRVRTVAESLAPLMQGEIACPASFEAGKRTTCERCGLCAGSTKRAKDIAIINHSSTARAALRRLSVLQ